MELKESIETLNKLFKDINEKFYNNELQKPVITLARAGKKGVLGHCTSWKAWKDKENNEQYEILINCDYSNRPIKETIATLMHECVHLYNLMHGVQDTSRTGTYHNKKFKEEAEKRGLIISKVQTYGWSATELTQESKNWIEENYRKLTIMYRIEPEKKSKKAKIFKHTCPECGAIARTTKRIVLICGECWKKEQEELIEPEPVFMNMEEPEETEED